MKKILKRLLISTALITPIAISTPLLLTSCSADVEIDKPVVETGPSIINGLSNIIKPYVEKIPAQGSEQAKENTSYILSTTNLEANQPSISNKLFDEIKNLTPGPSFKDQAEGVFKHLFGEKKFTGAIGEENAQEYIVKTTEPLNSDADFAKIQELINDLTFYNLTNKAEGSNDPKVNSFFGANGILNLKDLSKLQDKVLVNVEVVAGAGTGSTPETNLMETEIAINIVPKEGVKWAGLNNSHPISIEMEFSQNEKATLFDGGLTQLPKYNETDKVFVFNATLDKTVFGSQENITKITGTNKIREWIESEDGLIGSTEDGTSNSINASGSLANANTKIAKKVDQIFKKLTGNITYTTVTSGLVKADETVNIPATKITSKYIVGANATTSKQVKAHTLGNENINVAVSKIAKEAAAGNKADVKKYKITLDFSLVEGVSNWLGFNDANKNAKIQLILSVDLA